MSTITRRFPALLPFVSAAFLGSLPQTTSAAEGLGDACRVNDARVVLRESSASDLCGCTAVTRGFVKYIQKRKDFARVVGETEASCPQLALLLTDLPTASTRSNGAGPDKDETAGFLERIGFAPSGSDDVTGPVSSGDSVDSSTSVGGNDTSDSGGGSDGNTSSGGNDTGGSGGSNDSSTSGGGNDSGGAGDSNDSGTSSGGDSGGSGGGSDTGGSGGNDDSGASGGGGDAGGSGGGDDPSGSGGGNNGNGKGGGSKSNSGHGNGSEGTPDSDPGRSGNKNKGKD